MRSDYEYKLMMQPKQLNEQIRELRGKAAKLDEVVAARELENARLQEVRSRSLPVPSMLHGLPAGLNCLQEVLSGICAWPAASSNYWLHSPSAEAVPDPTCTNLWPYFPLGHWLGGQPRSVLLLCRQQRLHSSDC